MNLSECHNTIYSEGFKFQGMDKFKTQIGNDSDLNTNYTTDQSLKQKNNQNQSHLLRSIHLETRQPV